jgi:beta propeller repeat protein
MNSLIAAPVRHMNTAMHRLVRLGTVALGSLGFITTAVAQQQFQGVCANVKIEILQELAFERIGFEATLEITNNDGGDPITDFAAQLTFKDPNDLVNGAPRDVSDRFFVQRPRLSDVNAVDGTGVIGPTKTSIIRWFIIPKPGAGGVLPQGRKYEVGVNLGGKMAGVEIPKTILYAIPDIITVKPEPELEIRYFQPRDVQGDDPFTPEVEAPIPFTLGVLVKNAGYGLARSVRINSQQPKIVENKAGLILIARLLGARVQDSALNETSLTVNLGDIQPGDTRKGAWDMITSLSGEFVEFKASYTHRDDLGGLETSLIRSLEAHFISREVLNDLPGRDKIMDFLADTDRDDLQLPDTLYGSQGEILPVNNEPEAAVTTPLNNRTFIVTVTRRFDGWGYVRLTDPGQAKLQIQSVVRNDGKVIHARNSWTNIRYRQSDNFKLTYFNLFDHVAAAGAYTYTVTYANPAPDTTPPVTRLRFVGQVTQSGGNYYVTRETELYFTSEDESPVSIEYRLDGEPEFRPAVPFKITTPGTHLVRFRARDLAGNVEETQTAAVILEGDGPAFGDIEVLSDALTVTGDTLSFRSTQIQMAIPVGQSNVAVDAQIDVFRGIRVWPTVAGVPVSPTSATTTTLAVGGANVDFYKYRFNAGPWSAERTVATPLTLTDLSGTVKIEILARSQYGACPANAEAHSVSWVVDPQAVPYSISGLPPVPTRYPISSLTVNAPGVELYRWTLNGGFWRAEAAPGSTFQLPLQSAGAQTLSLIARRSGAWQAESAATTWTWLYDPTYGSNFESLPLVYSKTYPGAQGSTVSFAWDGRNSAGVPQLPGWYTVRIRLTDAVGNSTFVTKLVRIDDFVATTTAITAIGVGAERPDARGAWLVWQDRSNGTPNIRARHIGGAGETALPITNGALNQENPRTDGRNAVWQGRRANGNWDVFFVDLTDPTRVVALTDTPAKNEINPVVDWPWVVWQSKDISTPSAPWQLQAANLETGQLFTISPSAADQLDPAVRAGRVVWQDFRDVGYGEIYFRDLETGDQRRLTNNTFGQYAPDIDGHWVVWQDNRHTQVDLYGYDLRSSVETRLTSTPANESRPCIAGSWVLFTEDSSGTLTDNFVLLDLGTARALPLTRSATKKSFGSLGSGQLLWQEGATAQSVVNAAAVPALQPVFRNHNAVALTPSLVSAFGSAHALLQAWQAEAGVVALTRFESFAPLVTQTASWSGGVPTGANFALVPGEFVWVRFDDQHLLDLGAASSAPLNLPAGISAFTHTRLPIGTTGHALVRSLGLANVRGLRILDAEAGQWRMLAVENGVVIGADFPVPTVAVVIVDLANPVSNWTP